MKEKVIQMQQILACTCGLHFALMPRTVSDLVKQFRTTSLPSLEYLAQEYQQFFQEIINLPRKADTIYEFSTPGDVLFFSYGYGEHLFMFGPLLTQRLPREIALQKLQSYHFSTQTQNMIVESLEDIPMVPADKIYRIVETVLRQLLGLESPLKITQAHALYSLEDMLRTTAPLPSSEISHMRNIAQRYEYSAALIEAVKQGNASLAFHIVGQYTPGSETSIRNPNPIRNAQNYCIVFNTQLRNAMEQCGIHPFRVDKLSNEIGLQIEQMTEISKLRDFFAYMIRQYCRLVQQHAYPNLNSLTRLAVEYIKEHLSENITVKETAKALTVNANYLSTQFHQHMGISFIDYVNQERIHQAAALLGNTHMQIQQISQIIGYNNTSYFAKQFSRFMGISPRAYRRQHNPNA